MRESADNDISFTCQFLKTEDGGRKTPAKLGYAPTFFQEHLPWNLSIRFNYADGKVEIKPGDKAYIVGRFLDRDAYKMIDRDAPFELREGNRTVAKGVSILDLRPQFEEGENIDE